MNIKIKETGTIEVLHAYDVKTGIDYAGDLIGNTGALNDGQFTWSEEDDAYIVTQDTYDWWDQYITDLDATEAEIIELANEMDIPDWMVRDRIQENTGHDYDNHRREAVRAMNELREEYAAKTAEDRVEDDADLQAHRDILIDYDWDNQDEHLEWVATADKAEILSWVASVRKGEAQ